LFLRRGRCLPKRSDITKVWLSQHLKFGYLDGTVRLLPRDPQQASKDDKMPEPNSSKGRTQLSLRLYVESPGLDRYAYKGYDRLLGWEKIEEKYSPQHPLNRFSLK